MMWTKHVEQVLLLSDLYEIQVITSASLMIIMMICLVQVHYSQILKFLEFVTTGLFLKHVKKVSSLTSYHWPL